MKYIILLLVISNSIFAQCISGNCKNGFGKYDYGFAVYEGNFVAEKPNGKGTMDYGGGEKFVGNFKDGQEDGEGILYKNTISKNVKYVNGKLQTKSEEVIIGGNVPKVDGCIQGDCYNGFGIVKFESGNRYEGNFVFGVKSGEGTFYFAGGNQFKGNFKDNVFNKGTFFYTNDGVKFTGEFNADGTPKSGDYYYETNKATVTIENGKITKVVNPVAEAARKLALEQSKPQKCSVCSGIGMKVGESKSVTVYREFTTQMPGKQAVTHQYGNSYTRKEYSWPTECSACHGSGMEKPQGTIIYGTGRY